MTEKMTIVLGGDEIDVYDLPIRKVQEWRKKARVVLEAQEEINADLESASTDDASQFQPIYQKFIGLLYDHSETILNLVLDYLPDQGKRDEYAERATEPEILEAFFPLARKSFSNVFFWEMVSATLIAGSQGNQIGTKLPDPNGEYGPVT